MPSEGPNNGSSFGSSSTGTAWSSPSNAQYSDDNHAYIAGLASGASSQLLGAQGFGFSIPSEGIIVGIKLEVEHKAEPDIRDSTIKLTKDGSAYVGDNKADTGTDWPSSDAYKTYGGENDRWGIAWTPAEINASTFGAAIQCDNVGAVARDVTVDHIRITVYYLELSEVLSLLDTLKIHLDKSITETITLQDVIEILRLKGLSDITTLVDTIQKVATKAQTESISLSDTISSFAFKENTPLNSYKTKFLIDMLFDSGTKYFSGDDVYIEE